MSIREMVFHKMVFTKWCSQNGDYKMVITKW